MKRHIAWLGLTGVFVLAVAACNHGLAIPTFSPAPVIQATLTYAGGQEPTLTPTASRVFPRTPDPALTSPGPSAAPQITDQIINPDLPAGRFLVSPDTHSIAICTSQDAVIWNISLKDGRRQRLGEDWGCNTLYAWRPKSQEIFYLRETPAGTGVGAIVSVDADTAQTKVVVPDRVTHFALSPDGQYLAYTLTDTQTTWTLWIMDLAASRTRQIASGQVGQMFWSGDSTRLLYGLSIGAESQSPPTGGYFSIYQVASGQQQSITPEFKHLGGALWSPDSRWIAFTAAKELDQDMQVYLITADGGELRPASAERSFAFPIVWSPPGDSLLFISRPPGDEAGYGLWQHRLDTGTNTLFAQGNFDQAAYSPDGKKVAVLQQDFQLRVMPVEGGAGLAVAEQVAKSDLPSVQWLSATELAYLRLAGGIQIEAVP